MFLYIILAVHTEPYNPVLPGHCPYRRDQRPHGAAARCLSWMCFWLRRPRALTKIAACRTPYIPSFAVFWVSIPVSGRDRGRQGGHTAAQYRAAYRSTRFRTGRQGARRGAAKDTAFSRAWRKGRKLNFYRTWRFIQLPSFLSRWGDFVFDPPPPRWGGGFVLAIRKKTKEKGVFLNWKRGK